MWLTMGTTFAQKYALIDMEYILERIPTYESANKQLEALSSQLQSEIDAEVKTVDAMYKKYQADLPLLSGDEKPDGRTKLWPRKMQYRNCAINISGLRVRYLKNRKS